MGAIYPGGNSLIDIQAAVVQIRRELDRVRESTGGMGLVQGRVRAKKQGGRARDKRRTEGGAGSAAIRSAGECADDVFSGRSNPHIRITVIGKRGASVSEFPPGLGPCVRLRDSREMVRSSSAG